MSQRKPFGDLCQNHPALTAPIVYPHTVTEEPDGGGLWALYHCGGCGAEWPGPGSPAAAGQGGGWRRDTPARWGPWDGGGGGW